MSIFDAYIYNSKSNYKFKKKNEKSDQLNCTKRLTLNPLNAELSHKQ